ncbi:hypothetical protein ACXR2T_11685 [Leucobacter sp. HY1910]
MTQNTPGTAADQNTEQAAPNLNSAASIAGAAAFADAEAREILNLLGEESGEAAGGCCGGGCCSV